jgi:hypothetical protein
LRELSGRDFDEAIRRPRISPGLLSKLHARRLYFLLPLRAWGCELFKTISASAARGDCVLVVAWPDVSETHEVSTAQRGRRGNKGLNRARLLRLV